MACFEIRAFTAFTVALLLLTTLNTANALSCGQVTSSIAQCMNYARSGQGSPPTACCNGVRRLNSMAKSGADRQAACNCLKQLAARQKFNTGAAASIPGKCGVSVGYAISPSTDCSKVH
ncbi:hypothetical protein LUZ60_011356 [Juncus effusus]|nr:hypothetical protein LUZ60_011356 [Juncus effusus]